MRIPDARFMLTKKDLIDMTDTKAQEQYFELLGDVIDTPIYTSRNWNDHGKLVPGKQVMMGDQLPPLDHRSVGSNEVLIELDASSFAQNYKYAKMIFDYLNSQEIPHYCFWSGNKSIHIHIWLDITIDDEKTMDEYKLATKKGINIFREIRMKFAKEIIVQSGLTEDLIGKIVDIQKLSWNDLSGRATLIRACGGANKKADKIEKTVFHGGFKTYFPDMDLPIKKPRDNEFEDVVYPKVIEQFKLEEGFVYGILKTFNEVVKHDRVVNIDYEGKHLNLPCVRKTLEGLDEGHRAMGSKIVALACRLDEKTLDEAKVIVGEYANNCPQMPEKFTAAEANKWTGWIYNHQKPYWACGNCVINKVCDDSDCELFKEQHKEELALFDTDDPLGIIKKALDVLIVGEDSLKVQLFLLYLTKEFSPEWCILLDGTAATGKSHVMKGVAKLFGKKGEEWFSFSRITAAALDRIGEQQVQEWDGKIVIIEELQGARAVVEQLRVLISEGELSLLVPEEIIDADGTKTHQSVEKRIVFNTLFVTCNAEESDEGDQLASRSWILNTDQTRDQTTKIMDAYISEFADKRSFKVPNLDQISQSLKFLKKPSKVIFPFAEELKGFLSPNSVRARRDIKKMITLIKASAYFNQRKRYWLEDNETKERTLIADWRDVELVFNYAGDALNASTQGIGANDLKNYQQIMKNYNLLAMGSMNNSTFYFSFEDVCRWLKCSNASARKIMSNLCAAGFFENTTEAPKPAQFNKTSLNPSYLDERKFQYCDKVKVQFNSFEKDIKEAYLNCTLICPK